MATVDLSGSVKHFDGIIRYIDVTSRELGLLIDNRLVAFDVPMDCRIYVNDELVKLRLLQPLDIARLECLQSSSGLAALSIRVGGTGAGRN